MRLLPLHERRQAERKLARHLAEDFASSLRIAPGHSGLHRSSRLPTTDINHRRLLLGKINQMGTHLPTHHILRYTPFGNQPDYSSIWSSTTTIRVQPSTFGGSNIDAKQLGNQPIDATIMEVFVLLGIQFVSIVFCNIPKLLNPPFTLTLLPIFHRNISHPFTLKPFHHGPYHDPQAL